jgi:hypothetical protein
VAVNEARDCGGNLDRHGWRRALHCSSANSLVSLPLRIQARTDLSEEVEIEVESRRTGTALGSTGSFRGKSLHDQESPCSSQTVLIVGNISESDGYTLFLIQRHKSGRVTSVESCGKE